MKLLLILLLFSAQALAEPWYFEGAIGTAHHYRYNSDGDNYWRTDV